MSEAIIRLDLGCAPAADVSGAILLQSEYSVFLVFNARKETKKGWVDGGFAVAEFDGCLATRFGYPNDEPRYSIPRYDGVGYDICEVINSEWNDELNRLNRLRFPDFDFRLRHFVLGFHDSTFECLADNISIELSNQPLAKIVTELAQRVLS